MLECNVEAVFLLAPLQGTLTSIPSRLVRVDAVDRTKSHLVQLSLRHHALHAELQCITSLDAFYAKVEPSSTVTHMGIRQTISIHVAGKILRIIISLDATREVARVELTRDSYSTS